jgi:hypothetical protein
MKTDRSTWIWILTAGLTFPFVQGGSQTAPAPAKGTSRLQLQTPGGNRRIETGNVLFSWKMLDGDPTFRLKEFDVQIWDKRKRFKRGFRVEPRDTTGYGQLFISNGRQFFRRHGRYYWKVIATDGAGRQLVSGTGAFSIPAPKTENPYVPLYYPFSIRFQYNHWSNFAAYRAFIQTVYPKSQLQSNSDLSFGFHQAWGGTAAIELQERLLLLSRIGLGAELMPRLRFLRNKFAALAAWGRGKQCYYSTGLQNYASTLSEVAVGCDCAVMPGGNLTFSGAWIPIQRVRYGLQTGGLRTLEGSGFEIGVRLILPRTLLSSIRLFGAEIDFQRIPMGMEFGRTKDDYTGTRLDYRKFYIEYLF